MISLDNCNGSCNAVYDFSTKICVPSETKGVHVKVFENEAKTSVKHISYHCKCKFDNATCNSNQKWNNEISQCECKNYRTCKKIKVGIPAYAFVRTLGI